MSEYFPFPVWFYVATCVVALIIGVGIRKYLDRRAARQREKERQEMENFKKQQKRFKKQMKKAKKR